MDLWLLAFQAAAMTFVVTRSGLFAPLRDHGPAGWRSFMGCPLCVGVWVGMLLTAAQLAAAGYRPASSAVFCSWALMALGTGALSGVVALGFTVAIDFADGVASSKLGRESASEHRLPRGRRRAHAPPSEVLSELDRTATDLLAASSIPDQQEGSALMAYDLQGAFDPIPSAAVAPAHGTDLESIVTLLELAAIYLTTAPGVAFSFEALLDQARQIGGDDIEIRESDARIVLKKASFLKKQGPLYTLR